MATATTFLIAGATGRQGGAVVNALINDGVEPEYIYVLTRNASGSAAARLASRGVLLVEGDLGQPQVIVRKLQDSKIDLGRTAAFLAQAHGPTELDDAKGFIDCVVTAGLMYLVYSSVDRGGKELSDQDPSYCKTFSDKFHIEKHLETRASIVVKLDFTILRPVWFADNAQWGFPGRLCMTGWRENLKGKRMQVVTTKDIGRWAVEALRRPDNAALRNTAVSIASDVLSFEELDQIYCEETGQAVATTYGWLACLIIWLVKDLRTMFGFIEERNYGADMETLAKTLKPTTFRDWLKEDSSTKQKASQ